MAHGKNTIQHSVLNCLYSSCHYVNCCGYLHKLESTFVVFNNAWWFLEHGIHVYVEVLRKHSMMSILLTMLNSVMVKKSWQSVVTSTFWGWCSYGVSHLAHPFGDSAAIGWASLHIYSAAMRWGSLRILLGMAQLWSDTHLGMVQL